MIDMSRKEDNKSDYIVYLDRILDNTSIMYADGEHSNEDYSAHNYNVYRYKLLEQIEKYSEDYIDKLSKESFLLFLHKWTPIVGSIIGMFFAYNLDLSKVSKIILACVLLAFNDVNLLINEFWCGILADRLDKVESYQYYLKHKNTFIDKSGREDEFILPIEDIDNRDMSLNQVIGIKETIDEYKKNYGDDIMELSLSYKKSSK